MHSIEFKRVNPPIVIEADKVLLADTFLWAKKIGQFSGHSKVPPITVEHTTQNAHGFQEGFQNFAPGSQQRDALIQSNLLESDTIVATKNPMTDSIGQIDFLLGRFVRHDFAGITDNADSQISSAANPPEGLGTLSRGHPVW